MGRRRVLVLGRTGQLATELARAAWPSALEPTFWGRDEADFRFPHIVASRVSDFAPDIIIIAAAYTRVDDAEAHAELADTVNCHTPAAVAAASMAAPIVYISTDYVFGGDKPGAYTEDDDPNPINAYGRSKLQGELALARANPRHFIFRTSWVFSAHGSNFVKTMFKLASERDEVRVVGDQVGSPTAARDLAGALVSMAPSLLSGAATPGTYHLTSAGTATWHDVAEEVFSILQEQGLRRPRNIRITTAEYPTPARRPGNSKLDSSKAKNAFGITFFPWQRGVSHVVNELQHGAPR